VSTCYLRKICVCIDANAIVLIESKGLHQTHWSSDRAVKIKLMSVAFYDPFYPHSLAEEETVTIFSPI